MGRKLTSVSKIWLTGTSLVVTVPINIKEALGLKQGDLVEIDWSEIINLSEQKREEKKLPEL